MLGDSCFGAEDVFAMKIYLPLFHGVLLCSLSAPVSAASLFTDDFDTGADSSWGNEVGGWASSGGVYSAGSPGNFPNAYTSLPLDLTDFSITVDINNVSDGGVWLRSTAAGGTTVGRTGVLVVTLASTVYFHNVTTGAGYGSSIGTVSHGGGANPTFRFDVTGDTYSVFVNGSPTAVTSYNTSDYASGEVALYSNSAQTFDNVDVVPEPASGLLALLGALTLFSRRRN